MAGFSPVIGEGGYARIASGLRLAGQLYDRGSTMLARIYQPARNAMQSGKARTKKWLLEYEPESPRQIEPLMGWTASADMRSQVILEFDTFDEAVSYAEKNGIPFQIFEPHKPSAKAKAYSDNFRFDKKIPWTH